MEARGYQIIKLNGENYFMWRLKMEMVLQKEKLWNMVIKEPPSSINGEWRTRDQSARATIGLAMEDKLLVLITDCETARQTWLKLKTTYEHSNLTNKLFLLKKLYGSKLEEYKSMEEYLNSIKEISERLRVIGEPIKDSHLVATMLCGLPTSYDALVTAIESRDEKEINPEYVCSKLRDEAARKESHNIKEYEQESAMTTREKSGIGMRKGRIICHNCGKEGHIRRNCELTSGNTWNRLEGYPKRTESSIENGNHKSLISYENEQRNYIDLGEEWALYGTPNREECETNTWILDSGASAHMVPYRSLLRDITKLPHPKLIHLANGDTVKAEEMGKYTLRVKNKGEVSEILLDDVLIIPKLKMQLISVKRLCSRGLTVTFNKDACYILSDKKVLTEGTQDRNVFLIDSYGCNDCVVALAACVHLWHRRLGHRSTAGIKNMVAKGMVRDLNIVDCNHSDHCNACQIGSMTRRTFNNSNIRVNKPFRLIVTDLCGPIVPATLGGNQYIMTMTDQHSGYVEVKLLKNKWETAEKLIELINQGHNLFGYFPQIVRSDGGGEYRSQVLQDYFKKCGITHQTSVPHTPEQNGQAERINRTLLNEIRCMMIDKGIPIELWGEAAMTAAYLNNRVESTVRKKTPYELWHGKTPSVHHLRTFGSTAYAYIPKEKRSKLDPTSMKGILIGYGINKKSYRLWIPGTRKIINETSVTFVENDDPVFPIKSKTPEDVISITPYEPELTGQSDNSEFLEDTNNRKSARTNLGIPAKRLSY